MSSADPSVGFSHIGSAQTAQDARDVLSMIHNEVLDTVAAFVPL